MPNKNHIGITVGIIALVIILVVTYGYKKPPVETSVANGWETATTTESGISFKYPADLETKYITPTNWPPVLSVVDEKFSCTEAGEETERAGITKKEMAKEHFYCVTRLSEGAAGSIYTQYAYARAAKDKTEILTFSLRFVQCGNYNEPEMSECRDEQESFDIGSTIDEIFETFSPN